MADEQFDPKEKEVLSKWQHWKDYIDSIEGKNKDEDAALKIKQRARPLFKGCGNCLRGY